MRPNIYKYIPLVNFLLKLQEMSFIDLFRMGIVYILGRTRRRQFSMLIHCYIFNFYTETETSNGISFIYIYTIEIVRWGGILFY